ncbi:MAG TPA: NAD-dependent epimerase/dehydratase family protein [Lacunisphaera sp.]|jgi:nucleoside-diphosphate-sugar epimerase|nr:NAD-dependent epimerase/dehydratase family protein [Lacunisphaera sp.]
MVPIAGKRLVIFGCGYVGSALAQAALAAGARVEALTRNPDRAAALRGLGVASVAVADLASSAWHHEIRAAPEFIVNCVSSGDGSAESYRRSYVDGMRSILAWAAGGDRPIGTIVYTSSTSVYPQGGGVALDESAMADGATPNGRIIRESEMILEQAPAAACARHFILRLAGIYGPGRHHLLDQLRTGPHVLPGSGDYHLNLVHRDDIVRAILACFAAPASLSSRIYHVADDAPARRGEVVAWLADRLGRAAPAFDGSPGARRGGQPMPDRIISAARIRRELGWRPHYPDFRTGFGEILQNNT